MTQSHLPAALKRTTQLDGPCGTNGAQPGSSRFGLNAARDRKGGGWEFKLTCTHLNKCRVNTCMPPI